MTNIAKFAEGLLTLKRLYPNWSIDLKDKMLVTLWYSWFNKNTNLTDEGFAQLVDDYSKSCTYPPLSPKDIFDVEIEKYKAKHLPFEKVWNEAKSAWLMYESQGQGFMDYVKIDCGDDPDAMEFLQSKELGMYLQQWETLNEFGTRQLEQKVEREYNAHLERKVLKNTDRPLLEKISDGTIGEIE